MDTAHIAELLTPFLRIGSKEGCHSDKPRSGKEESAVLSPSQLHNISIYIDLLQRWNAHINLTAIRNEEEIVTRHFGESLFAARQLFPQCSSVTPVVKGVDVADIGSGAGFPGIPIKLWAPDISLTLIESNHKKATFLREVVRALTLTDINIQNARAETLSRKAFDLVTLRAVECFDSILPIASTLVAPGGRLALLIGSAQFRPAQAALPLFSWLEPASVPTSRSRVIAIATRR
jgi:16S rRNA (guanine527-N7)-methyltransferase